MKLLASAVIVSLVMLLPSLAYAPIRGLAIHDSTSILNAAGTVPAILEVWNPDLRSSNITSTSMFPVGSQFAVRVNLTTGGPIAGFDVTLNYNITAGPNILQAVRTGNELSGGLFDPKSPPAGCFVLVLSNQIDFPPGRIHLAAVMGGVFCDLSGTSTGTLFTIMFRVTGKGASFIDIVRTGSGGVRVTSIVGGPPNLSNLPFQPLDARFQNVPGIPPVARFSYEPSFPVKGDNISFMGGQSFDPDNSTLSAKGIWKFLWIFGDGTGQVQGANQTHVFTVPLVVPAAGNFTATLIVWDYDNNLPGRLTLVVNIAEGIGQLGSYNWSGYAITSRPGSVTDVKGSWVVPAIAGACGPVEQHSSFWVGIDGLTSPTVEQIGTDSACIGGAPSYFAWYEFFPQGSHLIHTMTVSPGDTIFGEVSYSSGRFNLTIADMTTGVSFSKLGKVKSAQLSSAEWIAEAPSGKAGILPLANFGTVRFGGDLTGVAGTCSVTAGGVTGALGFFGSHVQQITMFARDLTIKSQSSALSPDMTSFVIQWQSAGP